MTPGGPAALTRHLQTRIRAQGPIGVDAFMAEALAHPQHGYYVTRDPLGAGGDFVTAPEVSQLFGEMVGVWCVDLWQRMGAPAPVVLTELGPGRGTLMADALRAARVAPAFARAAQLHLVETSPVLREAQAKALAGAAPRWHDTAETLPPGPLLLVANEFLDALPVRQLVRQPDSWHERRVGLGTDGAFVFTLNEEPAPTDLVPPTLAAAPPGSLYELRPAATALAQDLGARLAAAGGAALFIDYGHYPSACGDTLQAVRRHRPHGVLDEPGSADLTAHVDFAAFAEAADAAGARVWGPVTQGAWLGALGIETRAARLAETAPAQAGTLAAALRRLTAAAEMGVLFKVLALTHPAMPAPAGFPLPEEPS